MPRVPTLASTDESPSSRRVIRSTTGTSLLNRTVTAAATTTSVAITLSGWTTPRPSELLVSSRAAPPAATPAIAETNPDIEPVVASANTTTPTLTIQRS